MDSPNITCIYCKTGLGSFHINNSTNEIIHVQQASTLIYPPENVYLTCANPEVVIKNRDLKLEERLLKALTEQITEDIRIRPIMINMEFAEYLDRFREDFEKLPAICKNDVSFGVYFLLLDDYITFVGKYSYNITLGKDMEFISTHYNNGLTIDELLHKYLIIKNLEEVI